MRTKNIMISLIFMTFMLPAYAAEYEVGQQNRTFTQKGKVVAELKLKKGDSIKFVNGDPFFHNIFSLSDLKTFDLGSFPKGDSRAVVFDKKGHLEIECAIHPAMHMDVHVE